MLALPSLTGRRTCDDMCNCLLCTCLMYSDREHMHSSRTQPAAQSQPGAADTFAWLHSQPPSQEPPMLPIHVLPAAAAAAVDGRRCARFVLSFAAASFAAACLGPMPPPGLIATLAPPGVLFFRMILGAVGMTLCALGSSTEPMNARACSCTAALTHLRAVRLAV